MLTSTLRIFIFLLFAILFCSSADHEKNAVVTMVTGADTGYLAGALALGQSLVEAGCKLTKVVIVTPEVDQGARHQLSSLWEIVEVDSVKCNSKYSTEASNKAELKELPHSCTKFAAWNLTQYDRVIYIESDAIVVGPIDDALHQYSNAAFLAASEDFPPDTFNSGFMVLNPSKQTYEGLLQINDLNGSADGSDKSILNDGLCPHWFYAGPEDKKCGRLPWIYNVNSANFEQYNTLRKMSGLRVPSVIHFSSAEKPWEVLLIDYLGGGDIKAELKQVLLKQAYVHLLWRKYYFQATKEQPPRSSIFDEVLESAGASKGEGQAQQPAGVKMARPVERKRKNRKRKKSLMKTRKKRA